MIPIQESLFDHPAIPGIVTPSDMTQYDHIILSVSGGKDSQAMAITVQQEAVKQAVADRLVMVWADTGAEWIETDAHCRYISRELGIPLVVAKPNQSLPDMIERRTLWPSSACRYCTSRAKLDTVIGFVRGYCGKEMQTVLHITGERKGESAHRALLPEFELDKLYSSQKRTVIRWRPMLRYEETDIWAVINGAGMNRHIAYDAGNDRLSCAICILANKEDIRNGAEYHPELAERYLKFERDSGHQFKHGTPLKEILK
jgi:3'-phosphoadenosine 5'-phosphosulfate sulfotransferase (PAPS reductase)/FAD synthetase